jgi:hypothetical protein
MTEFIVSWMKNTERGSNARNHPLDNHLHCDSLCGARWKRKMNRRTRVLQNQLQVERMRKKMQNTRLEQTLRVNHEFEPEAEFFEAICDTIVIASRNGSLPKVQAIDHPTQTIQMIHDGNLYSIVVGIL